MLDKQGRWVALFRAFNFIYLYIHADIIQLYFSPFFFFEIKTQYNYLFYVIICLFIYLLMFVCVETHALSGRGGGGGGVAPSDTGIRL